jgi:hypothetical protein
VKNISKKSNIEQWNTNLSFIIPIVTAITFSISTAWAFSYYKNFGINFLEVSTITGAFTFLFNNIILVGITSGVSLIAYFCTGFLAMMTTKFIYLVLGRIWPDLKESSDQPVSEKSLFSWVLIFIMCIAFIFSISDFVNQRTQGITENIKKSITSKKYIPINVFYEEGDINTLTCVRSLGLIGNYRVFIDSSLKTNLLKEDSIKRITYPFSFLQITESETIESQRVRRWDEFCATSN